MDRWLNQQNIHVRDVDVKEMNDMYQSISDQCIQTWQSVSFYLDQIPTVEQCIYLGITISANNLEVDLKRQMRKLYAKVNLSLRKYSKCCVEVKCF